MAGYTTLIHEMEQVLGDLSRGEYQRVMVVSEPTGGNANATAGQDDKDKNILKQTFKGAKIVNSDDIIFEDIPIYSPNGDELIQAMNFRI